MNVQPTGQSGNLYPLKGNMKVVNDTEVKDSFTPTDKSAIGDFFHDIGDKIKYLFVKDGTPEKEGAFVPNPNGEGMVWCDHPDPKVYDELASKTDGGSFCLKHEACAPDVFYWRPYMDPENEKGPYGMGGAMWDDKGNYVVIEHPDPKDYATGGKWYLDTACGCFNWFWEPDKPEKPKEPQQLELPLGQ